MIYKTISLFNTYAFVILLVLIFSNHRKYVIRNVESELSAKIKISKNNAEEKEWETKRIEQKNRGKKIDFKREKFDIEMRKEGFVKQYDRNGDYWNENGKYNWVKTIYKKIN